jgi:hypothetical protein
MNRMFRIEPAPLQHVSGKPSKGVQFFGKIKAVEPWCGGVVPSGHKQRYAAQSMAKTYADIAKKWTP